MKLLPPDKGGEGRKKKRGEGKGIKGKGGNRTSERSHSSKFATTPLITVIGNIIVNVKVNAGSL